MAKRRFWKRDKNGKFARTSGGLSKRKQRKYDKRAKKIDFLQNVVIREDSRTARGPINEIYRQGYPSRAEYIRGVNATRADVAKLQAKQAKLAQQGRKVYR